MSLKKIARSARLPEFHTSGADDPRLAPDGRLRRARTLALAAMLAFPVVALFATAAQSQSVTTLSALKLAGASGGPKVSLTPDFSPETLSYTATVSPAFSNVDLVGTPTDSGATVEYPEAGAPPRHAIPFGTSDLKAKVTNGGNSQTYTVTVTRLDRLKATFRKLPDSHDGATSFSVELYVHEPVASSDDNVEAAIEVENGTMSGFARVDDTMQKYRMDITPSSAGPIRLSVRPAKNCDEAHSICSAEDAVNNNPAKLVDKRSRRWVSTDDDARLRSLWLETGAGGYLGGTPKFSADTTEYRVELLNRTSRLFVVAAPYTPGVTVSFSGSGVADTMDRFDGGAKAEIDVPVGTSRVWATVTAPDGIATKTYTYTFERAADPRSHPYIKTLTVEPVAGSLESLRWPELGEGAFFSTVSAGTDRVTVTAEAKDSRATVSLQSLQSGESGASSMTLTLDPDANILLITVEGFTYRKSFHLYIDKANTAMATVADPLTAKFQNEPVAHDGSSAFSVELEFSETLARGSGRRISSALSVSGGALKTVRRVDGRRDLYRIRVKPDGSDAVMVSLFSTGDCGDAGAICTADHQVLSRGSATRIAGPAGISVGDAQAREAADATVDFVVTLSQPASEKVTVDYATEDGTATAGSDYTADSGEITFEIGETSKTVQISVLEDSIDEDEETFTLTLSNPLGGNALMSFVKPEDEREPPIPRRVRFSRDVRISVGARPGTLLNKL